MTGWKQSYNEEKFSAKSPEDLESIQREVVSCKFDFRVNEFLHIKQFPFEKGGSKCLTIFQMSIRDSNGCSIFKNKPINHI